MQADRDIVHIAGAAGRLLGALDDGAARQEHALWAVLADPGDAAREVPVSGGVVHGLEYAAGGTVAAEQYSAYSAPIIAGPGKIQRQDVYY